MKEMLLNQGAQEAFVSNDHRASAFIGGLGSGKTFAMIARGLIMAQQPKVGFWGPRGCFAAINYPVLKDVVLPQFFEMMDGSDMLLDYKSQEKKALLVPCGPDGAPDRKLVQKNGMGATEVLFRSLDQPNWMRGLELSWFGIDEGRHLSGEAWDVLYGRLRQKSYKHAGWVCSTPNGYDWMYNKFHPESKLGHLKDAVWYGAPTFDNVNNVGQDYIDSLMATYEGRFLRQEVYGEFVGVVDGAVFFAWDQQRHARRVDFQPGLPLYSAWDFGMGDLGVVEFAQVEWVRKQDQLVPKVYVLESLEAKDRTSREWVDIVRAHCMEKYGRMPQENICDPAGRQRNVSTGTSIIEDCREFGLVLRPAPKKPVDHAIRILNVMLEADRVEVDSERAERVAAAMASHKWPLDGSGLRTGVRPVHDWTSHYADALRYLVTVLTIGGPRKLQAEKPKDRRDGRTTLNDIWRQMDAAEQNDDLWDFGGEAPSGTIEWYPGDTIGV